jgi:hypothetical protein
MTPSLDSILVRISTLFVCDVGLRDADDVDGLCSALIWSGLGSAVLNASDDFFSYCLRRVLMDSGKMHPLLTLAFTSLGTLALCFALNVP